MLGELSAEEIEKVLHEEVVGRIGCHAEGHTYVVPITYAYRDNAVYAHSLEGLKIEMMRMNPRVCFEVDHMDTLANWRSVIAWGHFEELTGLAADHGLKVLMERLAPLAKAPASIPTHGLNPHPRPPGHQAALVYRLVFHQKTGRFERPEG